MAFLADRFLPGQQCDNNREAELARREAGLAIREEALAKREAALAKRELELIGREMALLARRDVNNEAQEKRLLGHETKLDADLNREAAAAPAQGQSETETDTAEISEGETRALGNLNPRWKKAHRGKRGRRKPKSQRMVETSNLEDITEGRGKLMTK
ncbi:hypothetical protein NA57DRAFT_74115 [Rhizodiscina lignyota]|uniref:Uncharacterized protein n=1 Tax=Rhizodiscina lignyota TaxID=1504668 RepID=A0A9P4IJP8_9PEZI|nr:hypothetical protein NA57DRAFT_74115 [Rhizodiscina lignyota]